MAADMMWRVYVEVRTPFLQDVEDLHLVIDALETHTGALKVEATVVSLGNKFSVAATIIVPAVDAETAADYGRTVFYQACEAAGYALGQVTLSAAEPAEPDTF